MSNIVYSPSHIDRKVRLLSVNRMYDLNETLTISAGYPCTRCEYGWTEKDGKKVKCEFCNGTGYL